MPQPPTTKGRVPDLIFWRETLGYHLRQARQKNDLSLRDLEKATGLSDSEIYKIEAGSQECRLDSFVRLCSALGLRWGQVLDDTITCDFAFYQDRILQDQSFQKLMARSKNDDKEMRDYLSGNLGSCCALAAHLVRCSWPSKKASAIEYPAPEMKEAYLKFANRMDNCDDRLERLGILSALASNPIGELTHQGLFSLSFLQSFLKSLITPGAEKKRAMGRQVSEVLSLPNQISFWSPFIPPDEPS